MSATTAALVAWAALLLVAKMYSIGAPITYAFAPPPPGASAAALLSPAAANATAALNATLGLNATAALAAGASSSDPAATAKYLTDLGFYLSPLARRPPSPLRLQAP